MYSRSETDPADRWESDPQAELEAIRQRDWDAFVAQIREWCALNGGLGVALREVDCAYAARELDGVHGPGRLAYFMREFADHHGWGNCLRAIAQALEADQAARQNAMERR